MSSWLSILIAWRGWPELARTLLAYAFAARIPVVFVMLAAIFGNWGTHFDELPPNAPEIAALSPLGKWLWIGLLPQMTAWIYVTVVGGLLFGGLAVALKRRFS